MLSVDWTFTIGNLITLALVGGGAVSAFAIQRFKMSTMAHQSEVDDLRADLERKVDQRDLDALRLEITRDYVSAAHLKEVEGRMTASVDVLAKEIRGLRSDILALYKERPHSGE